MRANQKIKINPIRWKSLKINTTKKMEVFPNIVALLQLQNVGDH